MRALSDGDEVGRESLRPDEAEPAREVVSARTRSSYDAIVPAYASRNLGEPSREHLDWLRRLAARLAPDDNVIDAGCGPGRDGSILTKFGLNVTGVDYSIQMLREARHRISSVIAGDVLALPVQDQSCAGMLMASMIFHIRRRDLPLALQEAARVLRPGGVLALNSPLGREAGWEIRPYDQHKHRYAIQPFRWFVMRSETELTSALRATGFEVVSAVPRQRHREWIDVISVRR